MDMWTVFSLLITAVDVHIFGCGQARGLGRSKIPQNSLLEHPEAHWGVPFHCLLWGSGFGGVAAKLTLAQKSLTSPTVAGASATPTTVTDTLSRITE